MKNFTLRELFWLVFVLALATGWALERNRANHWKRESEAWQKLTERRDHHIDRMERLLRDHDMQVNWGNSGPMIYARNADGGFRSISELRFPPYE